MRDTTCRSFWITKFCIGCEGFDFYQERSISLHGKRESRTRNITIHRIDKLESWIWKVDKSSFFHTKKSNRISRSKSIFKCPKDTIILCPDSLEKQYYIHEMLERFWTRNGTILRDMTYQDDRFLEFFCNMHTHLCHDTNLRNAPWRSLDR